MENAELRRRVVNYLRDRNRGSLNRVEVKAQGESVRLSGTVNSFYEKQLCLNACQRVPVSFASMTSSPLPASRSPIEFSDDRSLSLFCSPSSPVWLIALCG